MAHITSNLDSLCEVCLINITVLIKGIIRIIYHNLINKPDQLIPVAHYHPDLLPSWP